jgi:hypothetical protein
VRPAKSGKELRPYIPRLVKNRPDDDAIRLDRVEYEMRLEAKTAIASAKLINSLANAGKVGYK